MSAYVFGAADQSMVVKDGIAWMAWDSVRHRPAGSGNVLDQWVADGSPVPSPYIVAITTATVDAFAQARLSTGFADATTGKTWQCDDPSLLRWTALAASAGLAIVMNVTPLPTFTLIAADNTTMTLTAAQTFSLFNVRVMSWASATMLYARTMKNNILAGNPPADITAGWP